MLLISYKITIISMTTNESHVYLSKLRRDKIKYIIERDHLRKISKEEEDVKTISERKTLLMKINS